MSLAGAQACPKQHCNNFSKRLFCEYSYRRDRGVMSCTLKPKICRIRPLAECRIRLQGSNPDFQGAPLNEKASPLTKCCTRQETGCCCSNAWREQGMPVGALYSESAGSGLAAAWLAASNACSKSANRSSMSSIPAVHAESGVRCPARRPGFNALVGSMTPHICRSVCSGAVHLPSVPPTASAWHRPVTPTPHQSFMPPTPHLFPHPSLSSPTPKTKRT